MTHGSSARFLAALSFVLAFATASQAGGRVNALLKLKGNSYDAALTDFARRNHQRRLR